MYSLNLTKLFAITAACVSLTTESNAQEVSSDLIANTLGVKFIQSKLNDMGFDAGPVDGIWGRRTEQAVANFYENFFVKLPQLIDANTLNEISSVHEARHNSPFDGTLLSNLPAIPLLRPIYSIDIRNHNYQCDYCFVISFTLIAADFNNDGRDDIIVSHAVDDGVEMINFATQLTVVDIANQTEINFTSGDAPRRVHEAEATVSDFNDDGLLDVFIGASGLDAPPFPGEQNLLILSSANGLIDMSDRLPRLDDFAHGVDSGDIDGDGDADIIVATQAIGDMTEPYILLNDGSASFTKVDLELRISEPMLVSFDPQNPNRADWSTFRLLDLDNDGDLDLFMLSTGLAPRPTQLLTGVTGNIFLLNDGTGNFVFVEGSVLPQGRWGFDTYTNDADLLDINNDGWNDILLTQSTHANGSWRGHYIQVLTSDRNGGYIDETHRYMWPQGYPGNLANISFASKTHLGDINDDGIEDIVTQSLSPSFKIDLAQDGIVQVGIGAALNGFQAVDPNWLARGRGFQGRMPTLGDYDGDGIMEIVTHSLLGEMKSNDFQPFGLSLMLHDVPPPK
jgi:peptidoglycan hydrolase-like protein with peptidoglycan-binding domain